MEAVECGAAALGAVLAYHGRIVPLEELRVSCGVSRDGSKASNVVRAARRYGLAAAGYRKEPDEARSLPLPSIIHWNFNHFVVLEGFRADRVFINDPASGPRTVPALEFDQSFTGVVLTFVKSDTFRRGGAPRSALRALGQRLQRSRTALVFAVLIGLALVIPGMMTPSFTRIFVDQVVVRASVSWLVPLILAMILTAAVIAALTWMQQSHLLRFESKLALATASTFFWHVLRLPMGFFSQRYAGEIGSRVALNDRIAQLLAGDLATTVLGILVIAFYAVLMVRYDARLTGVAVVTAVCNMAALRFVSRRRTDVNQRLLQDQGKMLSAAMSGLQTIETLKSMGAESDFFARWSGHQAKVVNAQQELTLQTQLLSAIPPLLLSLNTALILGVGGAAVMDGRLSVGMLTAFQALALAFIAPVNRMVDLGTTLQEVRGSLNRLDDVLRAPLDPVVAHEYSGGNGDLPVEQGAVKLTGCVELCNVTFGYSPLDPPLIENFNLTLRPGNRVALVGRSGCGKSTLARLVCGLHEPWSGEILFDGKPRAQVPNALWNNSLAFVDQDVFLFEDSVKENLTLWDTTTTEHDIVTAGRDASIHDEIAARPGGYASRVEEAGRNFSGGQRQRLEIARALVGQPTILVLDEATSALDASTEHVIDDSLRRRGCTCLIVAHRLSTIRDCDEIILLDRGKILQRGTHDDMRDVPGPYRDLISAE